MEQHEAEASTPTHTLPSSRRSRCRTSGVELLARLQRRHARIAYVRRIPFPALLIIAFIALVNCVVWAICALILHDHGELVATAALSYSLGLRHALDADHISAIDLMTRRLLAGDPRSRPVTVGTWFSLGHSTIVIITSIVVAATAAGISDRFGSFGTVGGIIGSSVSAAFLILLGLMNGYILYKLVAQLRLVLAMPIGHESSPAATSVEGRGPLFRILKQVFKLINRPWKMYPLGVLFGLGFDTSSEIALLGISSIQAAKGTGIWLILVFPILFTAGMCLIDTIDGALMLAIYVAPLQASETKTQAGDGDYEHAQTIEHAGTEVQADSRLKNPIAFLYYSVVLTFLTVLVALIIGTLQLLTLILNVTGATGSFWDGVQKAGDNYDIIGGAICASFILFGSLSVLCYKPWRRKVEERRQQRELLNQNLEEGPGELIELGTEVVVAKAPEENNANKRVDAEALFSEEQHTQTDQIESI